MCFKVPIKSFIHSKKKKFVQFGEESCPAGEYLHSEQLWMLEKVSAALKTTPTTIPQTPHISENPQKKKGGTPLGDFL